VPGQRKVDGPQAPAMVKVSVKAENAGGTPVNGMLRFTIAGKIFTKKASLKARASQEFYFDNITLQDPKLWWPNTYGKPYLYQASVEFILSGKISDRENLNVGLRQIRTTWNERTRSREISVNGQKMFMKGGNWIVSDAMLRLSKERYDAEIRFHRDMNLNLIRVWGGALTERPEFYDACDKYGLLVMQDFWGSGDCNGRWTDPKKKDDQWTRRKYPDDHELFLTSAKDMVKMIRNHASLAFWCGGNEITLPQDILTPLRDKILPQLDGTRWFIDYSNSDEMSYNDLGGNGDGPYGIQPVKKFWEYRTWPFNSEIGSVGLSDMESLERFIPKENLKIPDVKSMEKTADDVWNYHKYISYENSLEPYGKPKDLKDFTEKAQLVNYDQYRQMIEGFSAHMWDWYTGMIIWKTQNPWTAMRGQMYDYYLDPNACLYGLRKGSEPLHVMYNPVEKMVMVTNNGFETVRDLMLEVDYLDMDGKSKELTKVFVEVSPSRSKKILGLKQLEKMTAKEGGFLVLKLRDLNKKVVSENIYWLADEKGEYSGLQRMKEVKLQVKITPVSNGKLRVTLANPVNGPLAFFNRISVLDPQTKKRILPSFYSDNYVSILPGDEQVIDVEYPAGKQKPLIEVRGWNTGVKQVSF
ncbi:MAG: glycosyl hydrolase, partial [Mucilaginibacter polytrichastri]|nr:glycosyl hydrolase [Mucilaginibacter polytrichastri]